MNYIGVINNFWNKYRTHPVSPGAVALFFNILHQANIRMWQLPMSLTNEYLTADLHTTKSSFIRYRGELTLNGYIAYKPQNRLLGSEYIICISDKKNQPIQNTVLNTDTDTAPKTAFDTDTDADSGLSSYNIKTNTRNLNQCFKQKNSKKNDYEIYNSGRYDFEQIERAARKKIVKHIREYEEQQKAKQSENPDNPDNSDNINHVGNTAPTDTADNI